MPFRTLELSDDRYTEPGLTCATVQSAALGRRADVTLFVPPEHKAASLPVVTLLHGVYGSHWAWALKGGAHRVLLRLMSAGEVPPMMLLMPSDGLWGDGSGYLAHGGADYARWIMEEVQELATAVHPPSDLAPHFIAGLSMGGYGALRLGALHPFQFAGISAHSSITDCSQIAAVTEDPPIVAEGAEPTAVLDAILKNKDRLPPLRFDCGTEDTLLGYNRELHHALDAAGVAHVYEEFPGAHTWDYWHQHVADSLRFFAAQL